MAKAKKEKAVDQTPEKEFEQVEQPKDDQKESTPEDIAQIPAPSEIKKADTVDTDESLFGQDSYEEEKVDAEENPNVVESFTEENTKEKVTVEDTNKPSKVETITKKEETDDEEENHDDDPLKVVDSSRVVDELEPGGYTTIGFSKTLEPGTRVSRQESSFVVIQQTAERENDKGKLYFDHLVMLEKSGEDQKSAKKSLFKGNFELVQ